MVLECYKLRREEIKFYVKSKVMSSQKTIIVQRNTIFIEICKKSVWYYKFGEVMDSCVTTSNRVHEWFESLKQLKLMCTYQERLHLDTVPRTDDADHKRVCI